jgi:transcriptional regulator with XRE-family HTH domain
MSIGERIKELRTAKKLTQSELAQMVGLSYIQVGRYETGKSAPSADVLNKLAEALGTTNDFLMNGGDDEVVSAQLTDKELLNQFKEVEKLNQEDKHLVKTFIDAFLTKRHIQKLAST